MLNRGGTFITSKSSDAAKPTVRPLMVTSLVILVYVPTGALAGIATSTVKVQDSLGRNEPPESPIISVPDNVEPVPHTSLIGKLVATNPAKTSSKSSENLKSLNVSVLFGLVIEKVNGTVSPALP